MAESQCVAKQVLEDQLTCAICLGAFKDPKLLQCFHVYCKDCLQQHAIETQGQLSLHCPTCRQSTLLPPATSVSDLQSAFHINHLLQITNVLEKMKGQKAICEKCNKENHLAIGYCLNCEKLICAKCKTTHSEWNELSVHEIITLEQLERNIKGYTAWKNVVLYCSLHKRKELELYCETCEELICHGCTVRKHKHDQYDLVTDTFEKHEAEIKASLDPVKNQLGIVNKALEQIEQRLGDVYKQKVATTTEIQKVVQQLHEMLEVCKTELIRKVGEYTDQKVKNLAAQKDEVETVQTQLASCLSFVRESLRTGSQGEVMKMKKTVMKQIKDMTGSFKLDKLPPCEAADLKFVPSSDVAQACQRFGEVYVNNVIDRVLPKKCYATGKGLELANVGERATATIHIVNMIEAPCAASVEKVKCELVSATSTKSTKCSIKAKEPSNFEIGFKAPTRGRHQLHIEVEGKHIKGSPFNVIVKIPVQQLGTPDRVIKNLNRPWGVAVNQRGEIIIVERGEHHVTIISPTGKKLRSFGRFDNPHGVATDRHDNIVVTDAGENCICKYTPNGDHISSQNIFECQPLGVSIHPHTEKIYVSDSKSHCVHILNPDLTYNHKFGEKGTKNGQFCYAYDTAFDSAGNVYVAEKGCNNGIQVFTAEGQFLRNFGSKGNGQGQLNFPSAIAIKDDVVYIADQLNNRVSIFKIDGTFLTSFGTRGSEPGQFKKPKGIAVDEDGFIYVSDDTSEYMSLESNGRIQKF